MVDIASLVCFRVAFGALMIVDVWRYSHYVALTPTPSTYYVRVIQ